MEKNSFDPNEALREMNEAFLDAETNEFIANLSQRYIDARKADLAIWGKGFETSYYKVTSSKVAQVECYKITLIKPHNLEQINLLMNKSLPERFFYEWEEMDIEIPVHYSDTEPDFVFVHLSNEEEQKNFVVSRHRIIELDLDKDDLRFVEDDTNSSKLYIGHLRETEDEGSFVELGLEAASEDEIKKRIKFISLFNSISKNYKIADQSR